MAVTKVKDVQPFSITILGQSILLKYTFNSFMYMEDLDLSEIEHLEQKPFKIIPLLETLLVGAINNDKKNYFSKEAVTEWLSEYMETDSISKLLENLMGLLTTSSFFVSLQKK